MYLSNFDVDKWHSVTSFQVAKYDLRCRTKMPPRRLKSLEGISGKFHTAGLKY